MEVEVETGAGRQTGPSFQSECDSASAMLVGESKRPRSTVEEGGRPGCDRPPWPPPRPQYWNIDTTSLYAAFAERTACFFRPSARPPAIAVQLQDCAVIEGH